MGRRPSPVPAAAASSRAARSASTAARLWYHDKPETISAASHLKELRHIGIRAWAVLEPRDRQLICDRLHRDLDNETIAQRLQVSAGTVRTAMSRAQARYLALVRQRAPEFFPEGA